MQQVLKKIIAQIKDFLSDHFNKRKYFACIYGSWVNGERKKDSDVDLLVATKKYTPADLKRIKKFIINLHNENGLVIDNEVPFKNKLLIKYKDFDDAVNLKAFYVKNGKMVIPKV